MNYLTKAGRCMLLALVMASPAVPAVINFEGQAVSVGGNATGIPDSPVTIGIATFTGGEFLNAEVGLTADQTGVYASEGLFGSGETNPLVINFASPVSGFSVFVLSADDAASYTVSDNLGDTLTMSLASEGDLGTAVFSLPGNGLTTIDITSADSNAWNFAIDDVTFTPVSPAPEPASLLLFCGGCLLVGALRHK